jgi:hypothetical protein
MIAYVGSLQLRAGRQSPMTLGAHATLEEIGWAMPSPSTETAPKDSVPAADSRA